jgi:hypothetical protein
MLETLDPVEIFISDLHLHLGGLTKPAATFRPAAAFLGDAKQYDARYAVKAPIEGIPRLRPMGHRRLTRWNLFWAAYQKLNATDSPWKLFLPLVWEDPTLEVRLVAPAVGLDLPVTVKALVWPIGWSTSLEVRLPGPVSRAAAAELAGMLRATKEQTPFLSGGKAGPASMVFKLVQHRLGGALLDPERANNPVRAHYVVAVADQTRKAEPYGSLDVEEREAVNQLVLGKADLAHRAVKTKVTRFPIDSLDFAIIHPDHGSVLCLTGLSGIPGFVDEGFHCFAANARTAWVQMLMLAYFMTGSADLADHATVGPLVNSARSILRQVQTGNASHFFTRELCKAHPTIDTVIKALGDAEEEAA